MNIARLLDLLGQLPEAAEHYKTAAQLDPRRREECQKRMALCFVSMRQTEKAYECYGIRDVKMPGAALRLNAKQEVDRLAQEEQDKSRGAQNAARSKRMNEKRAGAKRSHG